jgi:hypothetical protein
VRALLARIAPVVNPPLPARAHLVITAPRTLARSFHSSVLPVLSTLALVCLPVLSVPFVRWVHFASLALHRLPPVRLDRTPISLEHKAWDLLFGRLAQRALLVIHV